MYGIVFLFLLTFLCHASGDSGIEYDTDKEYSISKTQKQIQRNIDSLNIELTLLNTEIMNSKKFNDTIVYLELADKLFDQRDKLFDKRKEEKDKFDDCSVNLQKNRMNVRDISYNILRRQAVEQGFETDITTLKKEVSWDSEDEREKNFRYGILKEILKAKINMYIKPPLTDDAFNQALNNATHTVQLDLIEGFSVPISLLALYRAYTVAPSSIMRATLTNHVFAVVGMYIKSKMSAIAFIIISIAFWYALPHVQKRYPKNIHHFYDLVALLLLDRKIFGVL